MATTYKATLARLEAMPRTDFTLPPISTQFGPSCHSLNVGNHISTTVPSYPCGVETVLSRFRTRLAV